MLENPGKEITYNGNKQVYPDVKVIFNAGNNVMSHQQDANRLIRALAKVDTIVSVDVWWMAATRWADKLNLWAQFTDGEDLMYHIQQAYSRCATSGHALFEEFWEKGYASQEVPQEACA